MPKRLLAALVIGLLSLLLLEALLQAASLVTWFRHRGADEDVAARILCVGDSYTYGFGASSRELAYPPLVSEMLEQSTGEPWPHRLLAFPGRNSREMLLTLATAPEREVEVICLIGAVNDFWSRPEPLTREEIEAAERGETPETSGSGWRLECRTLRLLRTLRDRGAWRSEGAPVEGGAAAISKAEPEEGSGSAPAEPAALNPDGDPRTDWELLRVGEFAKAEARMLAIPEEKRDDYHISNLANIYQKWGKPERAEHYLGILRRRAEENPDRESMESYLVCLISLGREAEVRELLVEQVERFPGSFLLLHHAARLFYFAGEVERGREYSDRALPLAGEADDAIAHWYWCIRAEILGQEDKREALRCIVQSQARRRDSPKAQLAMSLYGKFVEESDFSEILKEEGDLDPELLEALRRDWMVTHSAEADERAREVLTEHLRLAGEMARERKAVLLLVSYPFRQERVAACQEAAAEGQEDVRFLDLSRAFLLPDGSQNSTLFLPDGHCNDAGYRLMAELIAKEISAL